MVRKDFPLLRQNPPVYLDSACMPLRPQQVIDAVNRYYVEFPGCGGRSTHSISQRVDEEVHRARKKVQEFINAKSEKEIIFLRNTTEGINLIARTYGLSEGDVVLTTDKEHNSNLLPWQLLTKKGIIHKVIPSNQDNTFSMENFDAMLHNVKLVALGHTSNLDGVTIPAKEIIKKAHEHGAKVLLDAAQSVPHKVVDVQDLDVDFLAFSGHKMMGPSGIGVLYGKEELLRELPHDTVGGETIHDSTYTTAEWSDIPHKFEAGLQHYAGIIGLGAAVDYIEGIGRNIIEEHEIKLNKIITEAFLEIPEIQIIGPKDPELRGGIVSFTVKDVSPHDIASFLDASNIMVRSGHHCVSSWFNTKGFKGSVRASMNIFNTEEEALFFVEEVNKILRTISNAGTPPIYED